MNFWYQSVINLLLSLRITHISKKLIFYYYQLFYLLFSIIYYFSIVKLMIMIKNISDFRYYIIRMYMERMNSTNFLINNNSFLTYCATIDKHRYRVAMKLFLKILYFITKIYTGNFTVTIIETDWFNMITFQIILLSNELFLKTIKMPRTDECAFPMRTRWSDCR